MYRALIVVLLAGCFKEPVFTGGEPGGDGGNGVEPNLVFVTSTMQPLGSIGSLEAADALCNQLAAAAGKGGTFVAWLSSSTMNARQRIAGASGWVRPDGLPFANTVEDLTSGKIFYPPRIDELGVDHIEQTAQVATATHADGTVDMGRTCSDFTSSSSTTDFTAGSPAGGSVAWTAGTAVSNGALCSTPTHLYCFGIDRQAVLPTLAPPQDARLAFVTSTTVSPVLGMDLATADNLCASQAAGAGFSGTFRALVATTAAAAKSRFAQGAPWYRPDGVHVTDDLVTLVAPVVVGASKQYPTSAGAATEPFMGATDTSTVGIDTQTCNDWTLAASTNARYADALLSSPRWANGGTSFCTIEHSLYCFQE